MQISGKDNVTVLEPQKAATRRTTNEQGLVGRWTSREILYCLFGAIARRCVDIKSPDVTCAWGTSDPADGPPEPWLSFHSLSTGATTRHFERSNIDGKIRGNLEYYRTLTYLHSGMEQPSYNQYMHISGNSVRDMFRNYCSDAHCLLIEELYEHHRDDAGRIVRDWELSDFEYHCTVHQSSPYRSPMLDYDFISAVKRKAVGAIYFDALERRKNNVVPFTGES